MAFPISSDGKIVIDSADLPRAIAIVEETIQKARPRKISVTDTRIDFTGGIFRWVTNWNLLGQSIRDAAFQRTQGRNRRGLRNSVPFSNGSSRQPEVQRRRRK
jgi:hypothetical protein